MENRRRSNQIILRLNDDEKYILDAKCENAGYRNKSDYLRHLILYGYTYFVDYSELHDYNVNLSRISKSLNQIAKRTSVTENIYRDDMEEVKEMMKEVMLSERKHCVHTNPIEACFDLLSKATVQKAPLCARMHIGYMPLRGVHPAHGQNKMQAFYSAYKISAVQRKRTVRS